MLSKNNYDAKKFRCCPYQAETGREYTEGFRKDILDVMGSMDCDTLWSMHEVIID